jgi:hypothetical protein
LQLNRGGFPVVAGKGKAKKEKKQGALHGLGLDNKNLLKSTEEM